MNANEAEAGTLEVLNCGEGHLEIKVTEKNRAEIERARRIIGDMLRRGYAIFVEGKDGKMTRVRKFKPSTMTYIIAEEGEEPGKPPPPKRGPGRPRTREIKATAARATAVGRSAGG